MRFRKNIAHVYFMRTQSNSHRDPSSEFKYLS